jgi:hypothetical protein
MKTRWIGKQVDLILLSEFIESFFIRKRFKTTKEQGSTRFKLLAVSHYAKDALAVEVSISGCPEDFTVEFAEKGYSQSFTKAGFITLPFGGGAFFLRGLKVHENWQKLESEFWMYAEETVGNLTNSFHAR